MQGMLDETDAEQVPEQEPAKKSTRELKKQRRCTKRTAKMTRRMKVVERDFQTIKETIIKMVT